MALSPDPAHWVLQISITAAPSDRLFGEQVSVLRTVADFDPATKTWSVLRGAFDLQTLEILQTLYGAASAYGSRVGLNPIPVPHRWNGPTFTTDDDPAQHLYAGSDTGRPLGQLLPAVADGRTAWP
ncbi:hypothetical protein H9Y04_44865 [Streptomyces sp. TRM66268-LWL]|uniref:Uncharacterized protein n=1 Tax=Streptomyces polyasparticus TaxID=2767826 RepID=A0ABR7SZ32_9ACTN|nr:hypothetical protein [Streptomyces polyasparticus]MBC9719623.1 hypothetical protein [Streptomyces polyasparticus]